MRADSNAPLANHPEISYAKSWRPSHLQCLLATVSNRARIAFTTAPGASI